MQKKVKALIGEVVSKVGRKTSNGDNFSALCRAVKFFSVDYIQRLLNNSCYLINKTDEQYKTILDHAVSRGNLEIIKLIVEHQGKVSLSFYNAKNGDALADLFLLLGKAGYDLNALDLLGFAPIHYASIKGYEKALKLLVRNDINSRVSEIRKNAPVLISLEGRNNGFLVRGSC